MCIKNGKKLLPINEVNAKFNALQKIFDARGLDNERIVKTNTEDERRILSYFISFAEHQFKNESTIDKTVDSRRTYGRDGTETSAWDVDMNIICELNLKLGRNFLNYAFYNEAGARHENDILRKAIYHYENVLSILNQWKLQIDLEVIRHVDCVGEEKKNRVFKLLSDTGARLSDCFTRLGDPEKAVNYCDIAILHAGRVMIKEIKIKLLQHAMMLKGRSLKDQNKNVEAKIVYEECYNLVAEIYYVDHPLVLNAANGLIDVLERLEEHYDAER